MANANSLLQISFSKRANGQARCYGLPEGITTWRARTRNVSYKSCALLQACQLRYIMIHYRLEVTQDYRHFNCHACQCIPNFTFDT